MSLDIVVAADIGALVVAWAIAALAGYRSFEMGRAFVSRIYRGRANWTGALALLAIMESVTTLTIGFFETSVGSFLSDIAFVLLLATILRVVDTGINVAIDTDFFHRDVIRWRTLRIPAYVAVFVGIIALIYAVSASRGGAVIQGADYLWIVAGFLTFLFAFAVVGGYSAVALIISSRRTSDRVLKAYVRFLGLTIGAFVLQFLLGIIVEAGASSFSLPALPANLAGVLISYLLYRTVMSLSTVGRIEKDTS